MMSPRSRDRLVCISLANLCFLNVWAVGTSSGNDYYRDGPVTAPWILCAALGWAGLSLVFIVGATWIRGVSGTSFVGRLVTAIPAAVALVGLNAVRQQIHLVLGFGASLAFVIVLLLVGLFLAPVWRREGLRAPARHAALVGLVLSPFALFTASDMVVALVRAIRPPLAFRDRAPARPPAAAQPGPRVVFVVFDGFDVPRPGERAEMDRLFAASFVWDNAFPRTNKTRESLPALISGQPVRDVRIDGPGELLLTVDGDAMERPWSRVESLFSRAHALGARSALIGWYHPYCRVLEAGLTSCRAYPHVPNPQSIGDVVRDLLPLLVDSIPGAFRLGLVERAGTVRYVGLPPTAWHERQFKAIHAAALEAVADAAQGLVFVHYPIPHFPGIFDPRTRRFASTGADYYEGNATLADRALGEVREAIERAGLTQTTALVVTADHWNRRDETRISPEIGNPAHRVPLLLHLPGQASSLRVAEPVSNVAAHYLALAVLGGRLSGPADLPGVTSSLPDWVRNPR